MADYTITEDIETVEENDRIEYYKNYKLEFRDPYGHIHISTPSGPTPEELKGTWTSASQARQKIDLYLNTRTPNNQNKINNAHREKLGLAPVVEAPKTNG